jgi:hypothetical protein
MDQGKTNQHSRLEYVSRVREEEALAPLSAPVFRPAGTHSSISSFFASPYSDFLTD